MNSFSAIKSYAGVTFGVVVADAGYGISAEFRHALSARGLTWAVGIPRTQKVYPLTVQVRPAPVPAVLRGCPPQHPAPTAERGSVEAILNALPTSHWRMVSWRRGTKGKLHARFAVVRGRVADGAELALGQHLPGEAVWLVGERRTTGDRKFYLTNHPPHTPVRTIIGAITARWSCEQGHQQLKEELGLDHFEGRSWRGLHPHALLTMIALAFLQHLRLRVGECKAQCRSPRGRPRIPLSPRCGALWWLSKRSHHSAVLSVKHSSQLQASCGNNPSVIMDLS